MKVILPTFSTIYMLQKKTLFINWWNETLYSLTFDDSVCGTCRFNYRLNSDREHFNSGKVK